MELKDLVGLHNLSGVEFSQRENERYGYAQKVNAISFILDNITYTAVEDPDDGYRSYMDKIVVSDNNLSNMFEPQRVMAIMRVNTTHANDILDLYDVRTGLIVLSVGTNNTYEYYPYCVFEYRPENMYVNQSRKENDNEI